MDKEKLEETQVLEDLEKYSDNLFEEVSKEVEDEVQ